MVWKILYLGNYSFPNGNAAGARVLGNGYLLRELGHEVSFVDINENVPINSSLIETKKEFDGFSYYSLPFPYGIKGRISYRKSLTEIYKLIQEEDIDAIIVYGNPILSLFSMKIRKWCRKKRIKYLVDCADWLPASAGNSIFRLIKYLDTKYRSTILNPTADGVITISSYLSDYYQSKGCTTVIIPPLVSIQKFKTLKCYTDTQSKMNLIYVGLPFLSKNGKSVDESSYKDRLDKVIEVLSEIPDLDFHFDIYGLTKEDYLKVVKSHRKILNTMGSKIAFHGRINNEKAIEKIALADFTFLLRNENRMTKAGFPTKFVETISCGTPIITTETSDLKKYLKPGKNGFFVELEDMDQLRDQVRNILSMDKPTVQNMKTYCKESQLFSFLHYKKEMDEFIRSL